MSVSIYPLIVAGGSPIVTLFSQSGSQAAGPLPAPDWAQNVFTHALVTPIAVIGGKIGTFSDASTGFEIFPVQHSQNNPNTVYSCFVIPINIYQSCYGVNQFVQATFFEQIALSAGVALLFTSDSGAAANGYYATKDGFIERVVNNVVTDVNAISYGVFAQNDVMRVSVDIQTTQNVFTVSKNGAFLATVIDNNASRITVGSPGFFGFTCTGIVANAFSRWKNFSAGRGA
jgi:hypothetical protein